LRERRVLAVAGVAMLGIAAIYVAVQPRSEAPPLPDDPIALARRLRAHPADWRAAGALSGHALDAPVRNRFALWHAAHDVAMRLAPQRDAPRMELAREAFFHWQELTPDDRRAALDLVAPLLRDPATFFSMAKPLYDLTGDLAMLRRWNPGTPETLEFVRNVAATNGQFAAYRELRAEVTRKRTADFRAAMPRLTPVDIVGALPPRPYSSDDEPLLRDALAELHRRPLTEDPHRLAEVDALIDYALRHHLQPLDGIDAVVHIPGAASDVARYRLAETLGMNAAAFDIRVAAKEPLTEPRGAWQHLRDDGAVNVRSWIDREMRGPSSITIETVKSDEVPPYVEIYFDDARVGEGEVAKTRAFALPAAAGWHRVEVRVANSSTRNAEPRLVRVVSLAP
jgi:hypothetical protein